MPSSAVAGHLDAVTSFKQGSPGIVAGSRESVTPRRASNRRSIVMSLLKLLLAALTVCAFSAQAQTGNYPDRPIKFVVPYPPGGIGDGFSRALAQGLSERLGTPVIVDNKPGANQTIGIRQMLQAPPDGYTIFLGSMTSLATNLGSMSALSYDPLKDIAPISRLFSTPLFLAVNASLPVSSVADLVRLVRQSPGKHSYASLGNGGSLHLAGALFEREAGLQLVHVPYRGSAPAITDLVGGVVTMIFDAGSTVLPQASAGKLRVLAVTGTTRSPLVKDVPTMAEAGFPVDMGVWFGLVAREGTPKPVIDRLGREVNAILKEPKFIQQFASSGINIEPSTPDLFGAFIREEARRWPTFMRSIGIVPE